MASVPGKMGERIRDGLKRFQPMLSSAKARDLNESNSTILYTDSLQYVFGYGKYTKITSEHMMQRKLAVR
jgi:hypothetical protein